MARRQALLSLEETRWNTRRMNEYSNYHLASSLRGEKIRQTSSSSQKLLLFETNLFLTSLFHLGVQVPNGNVGLVSRLKVKEAIPEDE
jgi:hypothetical protein